MARRNRYTGVIHRKVRGALASEGVTLRKAKPVITEASALSPSRLAPPPLISLPTVGPVASARASQDPHPHPPLRSRQTSSAPPPPPPPIPDDDDDVGGDRRWW